MIEPEPLRQIDRTYVRHHRRKLSYFSGCDYFRLSSHPTVLEALQSGIALHGFNVAASRMTTGNHDLYHQLEARLAAFFDTETAVLVSTGYLASVVAAQGLANEFTHALADERSHPALLDAGRFLGCKFATFAHRSIASLARRLNALPSGARVVLLTDGMFSRDGSVAPLAEYRSMLPPNAWMVIDDAHGAGVLGEKGRGTIEQCGISRERVVQTITLSKAFGCFGGAILCSGQWRGRFVNAPAFVGSTPFPLPIAAAALKAVHVLATGKDLRTRLRMNQSFVRNGLEKAGLILEQTCGPILALPPLSSRRTALLKRDLLAAKIFPPLLRYINSGPVAWFRFVLSSEHRREQLSRLVNTLGRRADWFG